MSASGISKHNLNKTFQLVRTLLLKGRHEADDSVEQLDLNDMIQKPEKDLDHIFDPFFTTKPRNGENTLSDEPTGSGLGLYSCRQLMREYNASISVESKLGAGTTFTISIPDSNFCSE